VKDREVAESFDDLDSVAQFGDVKEYDREIAVTNNQLARMQSNLTAIEEWNRRDARHQR
jgi:hypothetical protein